MTDDIITKTCSKCKENLPASEFYKNKSKRDGLQHQCKACQKAYREANREKILEQKKANYWANREKRLEQGKANYAANREKILGQKKVYRKANREKIREQQKVYQKANPGIRKAARHRQRARMANAEGNYTTAQATARFAVHGDSCIYCASPDDLQLDHIKPLNRGGSNWAANLAPACATCNRSKSDKWGEDLLRWVDENCTVERTRKILEIVLHTAE